GGGLSIRDADFNLPQHRHDLLGLIPLHRHDRFSSKWILSYSTWYKNGRSRQTVNPGRTPSALLTPRTSQYAGGGSMPATRPIRCTCMDLTSASIVQAMVRPIMYFLQENSRWLTRIG